jgi:arylsulfatase A-like enzyme
MMQAAGQPVPEWMQGIGLLPLLQDPQHDLKRKELYYHYYEYPVDHSVLPHLGIRGERYKLIYFYTADEWELYDLRSDPGEQHNLYESPRHQSLIADLKRKLNEVRERYKDHEKAGILE